MENKSTLQRNRRNKICCI